MPQELSTLCGKQIPVMMGADSWAPVMTNVDKHEPVTGEPVMGEPVIRKPVVGKPPIGKPIIGKPVIN